MAILNFNDLGKFNDLDKLNEEAGKFKQTSYARDDRYWEPELDKGGEGGAIIRFLPTARGDDVPFVRLYSYGIKGPTGKWYIENSPATLGLPCPAMDYNSALWDSGIEANKDIARKQKRRLSFITNIYVVKHKARPQDEGKVFLYKFGKKIWDKLQDKMNPDDEDKKRMNPFDMVNGANFRLKISQVSGFRNYDKSEFDDVAPLFPTIEEAERVWEQAYSLKAEIAPDKFKSYAELKRKLDQTLGLTDQAAAQASAEREIIKEASGGEESFDSGGDGDSEMAWLKELAQGN